MAEDYRAIQRLLDDTEAEIGLDQSLALLKEVKIDMRRFASGIGKSLDVFAAKRANLGNQAEIPALTFTRNQLADEVKVMQGRRQQLLDEHSRLISSIRPHRNVLGEYRLGDKVKSILEDLRLTAQRLEKTQQILEEAPYIALKDHIDDAVSRVTTEYPF